jgi:hypothetical protein
VTPQLDRIALAQNIPLVDQKMNGMAETLRSKYVQFAKFATVQNWRSFF